MITFSTQAGIYLGQLATRNRRPAKPATLRTYEMYIRNWIEPLIGEESLESFGNGAMKRFAGRLVADGLGPKSTAEIVNLVKQIVASAVTEEGDPLFPKIWNHKFLDLPSIGPQKQPTISDEQIKLAMQDKFKVFWAFLLGSGLRIGEAQAVRFGDNGVSSAWIPEQSVIVVRKSIWNRQEQAPKTLAAVREIDVHQSLNELLIQYCKGTRAGEYLFRNRNGGPVWSVTLSPHLKKMGVQGFHTTRRFRTTLLRSIEGMPEQLIKFWLGHEMKADMTDKYSKLFKNHVLRKSWAVKAGLGFALPEISESGHLEPSSRRRIKPAVAHQRAKSSSPTEEVTPYQASDDDLPAELFPAPSEHSECA